MIAALIGATVGVLTILFARFFRGERWLYSVGLLTLPSLYAFFALRAGDQAVAVREMIYGIPYIVGGLLFALVGVASRQLWSVYCGWSTVCTTWCMVGSSQTLVFPVGTPSGVSWLML